MLITICLLTKYSFTNSIFLNKPSSPKRNNSSNKEKKLNNFNTLFFSPLYSMQKIRNNPSRKEVKQKKCIHYSPLNIHLSTFSSCSQKQQCFYHISKVEFSKIINIKLVQFFSQMFFFSPIHLLFQINFISYPFFFNSKVDFVAF